ncbi:MAG TPA: PP2C family serine/threonine-protein phosphatase [Rhizomicrobium sp.]|jgi:hypothetical protein|nr:PP2C family serine/threonine-protein phosphatase [Rhizomicrobium sp.]
MWRYSAAKATGTSHIKVGTPCQDRFACKISSSGHMLIAVADGAGSASKADLGAELASATAIASLEESFAADSVDPLEAVQTAMAVARQRVLDEAAEMEIEPRELSSTLLLVALGPDGSAAGQIGDGIIAVKLDDAWSWVFWPQHGEFVNTTRFVIEPDAPDHIETSRLAPEVREVAVMTDGLEPLAIEYASRSAYSGFFEGVLQPLRAVASAGEAEQLSQHLQAFLESPRVRERADDDLTLVIASRVE